MATPLNIPISAQGPKLPREQSTTIAFRQIGWIGQTGTVYRYDSPPISQVEYP